jgi:hypothetical protein
LLHTLFSNEYFIPLCLGFGFGLLTRLYLLQTDYRQYPTYPHGRIIHLSLGVVASALGTIAVPALLKEEYTAITFLALAAQQFRDVRNMERNTLSQIDQQELIPRGQTYIEGIAMVFEGRNYLVIFTAFLTTGATIIFGAWWWGVLVGVVALAISRFLKSGKTLSHLVDIRHARVRLEGQDLYVDDIYIMNVGSEEAQPLIRGHGLGIILVPYNLNANVTIAHPGQRQAILHDTATILGVYTDQGEPSLRPMIKRDMNDGRLAVFLLPLVREPGKAMAVIGNVPVLENAIRMPKEANLHERGSS